MNRTKIEWADWTWNPIIGCSPASAGCTNCYAAAISKRFGLPWGSAHFMPERLPQPAAVKQPGLVFICSMADLGHETVLPEWRSAILAAMAAASWHQYIILTKRPGPWMNRFAETGAWCGVTAENQAAAHIRLPILLQVPATVRFVSAEPLLESIDLPYAAFNGADSLQAIEGIHWVIAGPETGPKARPCNSAWIAAMAEDCHLAGIPFFDKRNPPFRREFP